jgi:hypothetical protein
MIKQIMMLMLLSVSLFGQDRPFHFVDDSIKVSDLNRLVDKVYYDLRALSNGDTILWIWDGFRQTNIIGVDTVILPQKYADSTFAVLITSREITPEPSPLMGTYAYAISDSSFIVEFTGSSEVVDYQWLTIGKK